jgi:hypothetical protein
MVSKITCLKTNLVQTTIGQFDGCCTSHSPSNEATVQERCCDYAATAIDTELLNSESTGLDWMAQAILPHQLPDHVGRIEVRDVVAKQLRAPPLDRGTFLAKICVFRI